MSLVKKVLHKKHIDKCGEGGGIVSSWNDLTDKPFGEALVEKEYIFERGNVTKLNGTNGYILTCDDFDGNGLVAGQKYAIYYAQYFKGDSTVWEEYAPVNNEDFIAEIDENGNVYLGSSNLNGNYPFYFSSESCAVNYIWVNQFTYAQAVKLVGAFGGIKKIDEKYLPQAQADWEQSDETALDYIKNKPFSDHPYKLSGSKTNSEIRIEESSDVGYYYVSDLIPPDNMDYIFVGLGLDGNEYEVTTVSHYPVKNYDAYFTQESNYPYIIVAFQDNVQDTDILGRAITFPKMGVYFYYSPGGGNTVTAFMGGGIKKIDKKFLPDDVATLDDLVQADWSQNDSSTKSYIKNKSLIVIEEVEIGSWNSNFSYFTDADAYLRQNYPTNLASGTIKIVINGNKIVETTMVQGRYPTIGVLNTDGIFLDGDTTGTSYSVNIDKTKFSNVRSIKLFVQKYSQFNINALPNELKWLVNYNYDGVITENDRTFVLNNSITKSVKVASADAIKDSLRVNISIYDTNILMLNTIKDTQFKIKQLDLSDNSNVVTVPIYSYYTGELVTDDELPYGVMLVAQSWKSGEWILLNPIPKLSDCIINSSTEGSTKKFKITVDDSGTISATEVTN